MEIDQALLESLPMEQRLKLVKRMRQEQIRRYYEREEADNKGTNLGKPDINKQGSRKVQFDGGYRLQDAVANYDEAEVARLVKEGVHSKVTLGNDRTLLHLSASHNFVAAAEILLEHNASVNAQDGDWWTPLHIAASNNSMEMCRVFISHNADPSILDVDGNFASDYATGQCKEMLLDFMLKRGMDKGVMKSLRMTVANTMMTAITKKMDEGLDFNTPNEYGVTSLHVASANGYKAVVQLLLQHQSVKVNADDDAGWTPLHVAAKWDQARIVRLLLQHGANPHAKNHNYQSPQDLAESELVQEMLKQAEVEASHMEELPSIPEDDVIDQFESTRTNSRNLRRGSLSKQEEIFEFQTLLSNETQVIIEDQDRELASYEAVDHLKPEDLTVHVMSTAVNDDLAALAEMNQDILLHELGNRYSNDQIYTYLGGILVAINPFKALPYYTAGTSHAYSKMELTSSLAPHIFAVAERAFRSMLCEHQSQCCVISGESGAGKTESSKFLVQHLLLRAKSEETRLNRKIREMGPLLEAFGNAVTKMNDNSSRFGKYLELQFSNQGLVLGAMVKEYMLEKSRVVHQANGERNFHIFYYMLGGLSPDEKQQYCLQVASAYRCLCKSGTSLDFVDSQETWGKFDEVKTSLHAIGFTSEDEQNLLTLLSAVLLIGNVSFISNDKTGGNAEIDNVNVLVTVAKLLSLNSDELGQSLTSEATVTRGEQIIRHRNVVQAADCRDALAKAIYGKLFAWIVNSINHLLQKPEDCSTTDICEIGILDIFGFENFEQNSFEQLCINLANEQLQYFFNNSVFAMEKEECQREGISLVSVDFTSNKPVLDLLLEKHTGVLAQLDEETRFSQATDLTLGTKLHKAHAANARTIYLAPRDGGASFSIVHYAGIVKYNLMGFLDKNRDTLAAGVALTLKTSGSLLIREMFQARITKTGSLAPSDKQRRSRRSSRSPSPFSFFKKRTGENQNQKKKKAQKQYSTGSLRAPMTVASYFRNSLTELIDKMTSCSCHFIRCIKPNSQKAADAFVDDFVLAQLRYTGLLETTRIRKQGYPSRLPYEEFLSRYSVLGHIITPVQRGRLSSAAKCQAILEYCKLTDWQIGPTKVFLKYDHSEKLTQLADYVKHEITVCQRVIRGFIARRSFSKLLLQQKEQSTELKDFLQAVDVSCDKMFVVCSQFKEIDRQQWEYEQECKEKQRKLEEKQQYEEQCANEHQEQAIVMIGENTMPLPPPPPPPPLPPLPATSLELTDESLHFPPPPPPVTEAVLDSFDLPPIPGENFSPLSSVPAYASELESRPKEDLYTDASSLLSPEPGSGGQALESRLMEDLYTDVSSISLHPDEVYDDASSLVPAAVATEVQNGSQLLVHQPQETAPQTLASTCHLAHEADDLLLPENDNYAYVTTQRHAKISVSPSGMPSASDHIYYATGFIPKEALSVEVAGQDLYAEVKTGDHNALHQQILLPLPPPPPPPPPPLIPKTSQQGSKPNPDLPSWTIEPDDYLELEDVKSGIVPPTSALDTFRCSDSTESSLSGPPLPPPPPPLPVLPVPHQASNKPECPVPSPPRPLPSVSPASGSPATVGFPPPPPPPPPLPMLAPAMYSKQMGPTDAKVKKTRPDSATGDLSTAKSGNLIAELSAGVRLKRSPKVRQSMFRGDHSETQTTKTSVSNYGTCLGKTPELNGTDSQSTHIPAAAGQTVSKQHTNTTSSEQLKGNTNTLDSDVPAWKVDLLKRKKEAAKIQEELQLQEDTSTASRWEGVPVWKRKLIEDKERKATSARATQENEHNLQKEKELKLAAMPEWKRQLVLKKQGKI